MKLPLVSILLPVFNASPFLRECLNSICAQTYSNWELIAVDDFSDDDSLAILTEFTSIDPRIKVHQNTEKGIIPALRLAFEKSLGKMISRMDADDIMHPEKIGKLVKILDEETSDAIAINKVSYFSSQSLGNGYVKYAKWLNGLIDKNNHWTEIYKECVIPSPSWMIARNILDKIGGFKSDVYPEDYDLCFRLYKSKIKIVSCSDVLHHWRDHAQRASRNDSNYADNRFLDLKLTYFLDIDYNPGRTLILWGAGAKGKWLAKKLSARQIPFKWVTNNPLKIGHNIYGLNLLSDELAFQLKNVQVIIAVASPSEQKEMDVRLQNAQFTAGKEYFYFC